MNTLNRLDSSSGYIIVAQSDGLSSTSSNTLIAIPATSGTRPASAGNLLSVSRPPVQMFAFQAASASTPTGTQGTYAVASASMPHQSTGSLRPNNSAQTSQIRFVQIGDLKPGSFPANGTLRLGTIPNSTNGVKRATQPASIASSSTRTVAIMPSGGVSINNSSSLTSGRNNVAQHHGGASDQFAANHRTISKFGTQTIAVLPSHVSVSPVKMEVGSTQNLSNNSTTWKPPTVSSNNRSLGMATSLSPSKLIIQINSNQLPIFASSMQPQQQSRPVLASIPPRLPVQSSTHSGATTFSTVNSTQFLHLIPPPVPGSSNVSAGKSQSFSAPSGNRTKQLPASSSASHSTKSSAQTTTTQRLILPATPQVQLNMAVANSNIFHAVPGSASGSTVAFLAPAALNQHTNYTFVQTAVGSQASTNHQLQHVSQSSVSGANLAGGFHNTNDHMAMAARGNYAARQLQYTMDTTGPKQRKPCNCTKSQCLKLYCECFANGEFCSDCNCFNCFNSLEHEDDRSKAIKSCIDRNPHAFHPKIGKGGSSRQHSKGCNCKRSGCLKNYCECYEAKISCSNLCRCVGCRNVEENADRQKLLQLADAAEVRVQQQSAAESKLSSQIFGPPVRPQPPPAGAERLPYTFVTLDVVEATCSCIIAEVQEGESFLTDDTYQEQTILEEFGRCLTQVISTAGRSKAPSP